MWQEILALDQQLLLMLNVDGNIFWDTFFYYASGKLTWAPLYVAILYGIYRKFGLRTMLWATLFLGVSVGLADQICNLFKTYTPKFRPSHNPQISMLVHTVRDYRGGLYGTVSAHAAISFVVAVFTSELFRRRWYTISITTWALLVAYSRIYLGVHFPLDIIFGTLLGITIGYISILVFRRYVYKSSRGSSYQNISK